MADEINDEIVSAPSFKINKIDFRVPDGMLRPFATNIVVQGGEHTITISFFETQPPIFIGSTEEKIDQVKKIQTVPAYCVASVVVAIEKMPGIIKVMQGIYDDIKKKQAEKNQEKK